MKPIQTITGSQYLTRCRQEIIFWEKFPPSAKRTLLQTQFISYDFVGPDPRSGRLRCVRGTHPTYYGKSFNTTATLMEVTLCTGKKNVYP
jgi:hypothetical protein